MTEDEKAKLTEILTKPVAEMTGAEIVWAALLVDGGDSDTEDQAAEIVGTIVGVPLPQT